MMMAIFNQISKDIVKTMTQPEKINYNSTITPAHHLKKYKKYGVEVKVKKIKNKGYQMLVFFTDNDGEKLVYATKTGELQLKTRTVQNLFRKNSSREVTTISFTDVNAKLRFDNWCNQFRVSKDIQEKQYNARHCAENF